MTVDTIELRVTDTAEAERGKSQHKANSWDNHDGDVEGDWRQWLLKRSYSIGE